MTPAIGYLRCSGLMQCGQDRDGFERQCAAVERFCADRGYELQAVYLERGVSGKIDPTKEDEHAIRPAFKAMLSAMLENCCRNIVVENLSRLAREYRVQENMLFYLVGKGLDLLSADSGENVTEAILDNPMKKAAVQMQGVFFELERSMIIHKLQSGRRKKRQMTGKPCGGPPPFGHTPEEKLIVNRIHELKSTGLSPRRIAEALNAENTSTRHGGLWHRTSVNRVLGRVG